MTTDPAGQAARAYATCIELLAAANPGGASARTPRGNLAAVTSAVFPTLNGLLGVDPEPDAADLAAGAARLGESLGDLPWSVQLRGTPDGPTERFAADHGLTERNRAPFMIRRGPAGPRPGPSRSVRVRTITGDEEALYVLVLGAGYEAPPGLFRPLARPAFLDLPEVTAYLVEDEGVPVSTALGVLVDGCLGVFSVATPPAYRRRGYAAEAVGALLRDGLADGAETAFLHSSAMAVPLYESFGFRVEEYWTQFTAP